MVTVTQRLRRIIRRGWSIPIIVYQRVVSPWLPRRCIYHPTCSSYAREAIERHGIISGTVIGGARILRCTGLFFDPGYDPVPEDPSIKVIADGYRTFRRRK